jgi:hypothetical protein
MLFWTVAFFITYSLIYFVASQRKMRRLRNTICTLRENLDEKRFQQRTKTAKPYYQQEMAE